MNSSPLEKIGYVVGISLVLGWGYPSPPTAPPLPNSNPHHNILHMNQASGKFEVQLTPQSPDAGSESAPIGRMLIVKQYDGGLKAESQGQMLAYQSGVEGSAGYVAIERVNGNLDGRKGSFVLQHSGIMDQGDSQLTVIILPDSGTEELAGIQGSMTIKIEDGNHYYDLEYLMP